MKHSLHRRRFSSKQQQDSNLPLSMEPFSQGVCVVMSNDDLLVEILFRLPATSLFSFKYVSKRWLSLITDASFTRRRSQFPDLDPPSGFFIAQPKRQPRYKYDLVPLDIRIPVTRSAVFNFGSEGSSNVKILQSCNGLLLCCSGPKPFKKFYVYNPTINVFRMLPPCNDSDLNICWYRMRIAFDPAKSHHYKVIYALTKNEPGTHDIYIQIQTYSSQTCNWTVCGDRFYLPINFCNGIYWNEAIHWLIIRNERLMHYKLDTADHPKLTTIPTPGIMKEKDFDSKLLVSGGRLLFFCRSKTQLSYVCEMRNDYSGWSVKYTVNLNDIMNPLSETWMAYRSVWGIVLGAREEDSFIVMEVSGKVVQFNFVSKTVHMLGDIGSVTPSCESVHQFIASFASV